MKEEWRVVECSPSYEVSNCGNIRRINCRLATQANRKLDVTWQGYLRVRLCENGNYKNYFVHRLVARAFIYESNLDVNHKDLNKANNTVENLEYVTPSENALHSYKTDPHRLTRATLAKRRTSP